MSNTYHYIRWFNELTINDIALVGGKNASLGEMYRELGQAGIQVPNGFAITAEAYRHVLDRAGVWPQLHDALDGLDAHDVNDLARRAARARELVYAAALPNDLQAEIHHAFAELQREYGDDLSVAVRSSATAEDLPTASFAGQQDTYLNIHGGQALIDACKRCFASLFTDRAIHYRVVQGFDHFSVGLSVGVMKMVRSDLAASGVMFSLDTESGFDDVVFITAAYGLGENVVQGAVDPDEFYVHKPTFGLGYRAVLKRNLGAKKIRMIYAEGRTREATHNVVTANDERRRFCISDDEVLQLAGHALTIERHYGRAMDMEWAKDGLDGQLYIVQARPETVASQRSVQMMKHYRLQGSGPVLLTGRAVGGSIAAGRVRVIDHVAKLNSFKAGEILVADMTTPDWEPVMKMAAAIVTNRGGRTCHAAIVARELGVSAVIGCDQATTVLQTGSEVTVSCAEGDVGKVYQGRLPFVIDEVDLSQMPRPKTRIMLNLGNPELAFKHRFLPNDGVGLARMEFIITQYIQAHPMALIHPERVTDDGERQQLRELTAGYARPEDFFTQRLSEGVATIAAAFYPKPVVVRMSDFKTNEYASLLGGRGFEQDEANPMIGFRGASRYVHPAYAEAFALECAAIKRVRDGMGLRNVILMIPFCRRIDEAHKVLDFMARCGLRRGDNGLEIYVMCEIPNNVIQIDAFAEWFDGFSIGSNDLTQLTLGVDRDSAIVADAFDERDPGVKAMMRMAVEGARRNGRHCGLCGQAPSDYPDMAAYLVEIGIDSISLNPDTVLQTTQMIVELERRLGR
ncbi:MAG: phosphoenolpyruvate synthase [Methylomonas sp.]|nr:MAG: phosphoenolpyruvate synthase [Methylomonas sp.]PPD26435.1 MAG: phosphoenolpyruvate synthase [Methylomonas sp.]PPD38184.1 MAG: phosphoenolpyruvate synthase [Methylomonas sp.]PPD41870.1 MAG: phosphoenolpyruvate synthase [Methylomonas sp.]PPD51635.1 MAG: phosphoenolpyruvate synthase [Methylomonas sp.]